LLLQLLLLLPLLLLLRLLLLRRLLRRWFPLDHICIRCLCSLCLFYLELKGKHLVALVGLLPAPPLLLLALLDTRVALRLRGGLFLAPEVPPPEFFGALFFAARLCHIRQFPIAVRLAFAWARFLQSTMS
jgi:hypothetical protein